MSNIPSQQKYIIIEKILNKETFVKAILSNSLRSRYKRIEIKPVVIKNKQLLQFSFFTKTQNTVKNINLGKVSKQLKGLFDKRFSKYHIFNTDNDYLLNISKNSFKEEVSKPTFTNLDCIQLHNIEKNYIINLANSKTLLEELRILTKDGQIKSKKYKKHKQINKFIEILDLELKDYLKTKNKITLLDLGCGKGDLTFIVYHYFLEILGKSPMVLGVDVKRELIKENNRKAKKLGLENLSFECLSISEMSKHIYEDRKESQGNFSYTNPDIVLALHA